MVAVLINKRVQHWPVALGADAVAHQAVDFEQVLPGIVGGGHWLREVSNGALDSTKPGWFVGLIRLLVVHFVEDVHRVGTRRTASGHQPDQKSDANDDALYPTSLPPEPM